MSDDPTICCSFRLEVTVFLPLTPRTIAAMPKAMSTTPAATPPNSKIFFMVSSVRTLAFAMAAMVRGGGRDAIRGDAEPRCGFPRPAVRDSPQTAARSLPRSQVTR